MATQTSFAELEYAAKKKRTRRKRFLASEETSLPPVAPTFAEPASAVAFDFVLVPFGISWPMR
jgi:hypothetical protein